MVKGAKKVFQGKLYSVWQWEQKLYDGSFATFERIARADYAFAVGILEDQKIMILQDEQPDREAVLTPAGGKVDAGESPQEALQREFLEEAGYTIGEIRSWFSYRPSSKVEMTIHAFVARKLSKVQDPAPEPGERLKELHYSFDEFLALGEDPLLRDWMLKVVLLQALLHPKKKGELRKLFYE